MMVYKCIQTSFKEGGREKDREERGKKGRKEKKGREREGGRERREGRGKKRRKEKKGREDSDLTPTVRVDVSSPTEP